MNHTIYIYPIDSTEEQRAAILRDQYQGTTFSEEEVAALDAVVQLSHRIGGGGGGGADKSLTRASRYALQRGWIMETDCGYEPTIAGRLESDELLEQGGFNRSFLPWDQQMRSHLGDSSIFLPDELVPVDFVLRWLQRYEVLGCTNEAVLEGGYFYLSLAQEPQFARFPATRFAGEVVVNYVREGLVRWQDRGLYLTDAGLEKRKELLRLGELR